MAQLKSNIAKASPTDASVLVTGENGTGKELVATQLYLGSKRRDKPFVKVNCPGINLLMIFLPIIVLTGLTRLDDFFGDLGDLPKPDSLVEKPIERDAFVQEVERLVGAA